MIQKSRIIYFLFGLVLCFDILYKTDSSFYILFGGSLIALATALYLWGNNGSFRVSKTLTEKMFWMFVMYSFITIPCSDGMEFAVVKNLVTFVLFFVTIIWLARYTNNEYKRKQLLETFLIVFGLIFIYKYITNYQVLNLQAQILSFFSTSERYRYSYGLGHYNDAGLDAVSIFIITIIYVDVYKRSLRLWKKTVLIGMNLIALIVLLASSCRNALLSFFIFLCTYLFLKTSGKREKKYSYVVQIMLVFITGCFIILVLMDYYNVSSLKDLMRYSGRMVAFNGIETMVQDGKYIFGYGLTNKSDFLTYAYRTGKTFIMDSSYIYYIVHSGIIGFCIMLLIIISLIFRMLKVKTKEISLKRYIIAASFMFLFTGLFETTVFYVGMPVSLVFTTICLQFIINGEKNEAGT